MTTKKATVSRASKSYVKWWAHEWHLGLGDKFDSKLSRLRDKFEKNNQEFLDETTSLFNSQAVTIVASCFAEAITNALQASMDVYASVVPGSIDFNIGEDITPHEVTITLSAEDIAKEIVEGWGVNGEDQLRAARESWARGLAVIDAKLANYGK